jgi:uroporphyrin-III C-methyltransferase
VITGTTSEENCQMMWLHNHQQLVVILMGMSKLDQIVDLFQNESKGETPVAIIQNGTTAQEKK